MSEQEFDVKNAVSGVLVIDKPVGMTSHDVVQVVRRGTGIRRAGHTGTLDPRASGVLVVLVGPAVRLSEFVSASDKKSCADNPPKTSAMIFPCFFVYVFETLLIFCLP